MVCNEKFGCTKTGPKLDPKMLTVQKVTLKKVNPQKVMPSEIHISQKEVPYRIMRAENHTHHTKENSYYDGGA